MLDVTALPLVIRDQVAQAYRPGTEPTDAALRTLRNNAVISEGLHSPIQDPKSGHLLGNLQFYCALSRDAALLWRLRDTRAAKSFARASDKVERGPAAQQVFAALKKELREQPSSVADVGHALTKIAIDANVISSLIAMTKQIRDVREQLGEHLPVLAQPRPGRVARLNRELVSILLSDRTYVTLPRASLESQGLARLGAAVVVTWETREPGEVVVRVEPALELRAAGSSSSRLLDRGGYGRDPKAIAATLEAMAPWPTRLRESTGEDVAASS